MPPSAQIWLPGQREPMDGLKTLCLLRGRFVVAAREEIAHDDVVGRRADTAPKRGVGRFAGACVVPDLDPVSDVEENARLDLPDDDASAGNVAIVGRS